MANIVCYASDGSVLEYYYQWSTDQKLIIKGADTYLAPIFYFSNAKHNTAFIVEPEISNDNLIVTVPNILLQYALPIIIDVDYSVNSKSDFSIRIPVMPKAKPGDYVHNDNTGSGESGGGAGSSIQIADNLTTDSAVIALAASQGVALKSMIDNISDGIGGNTFVIVQDEEPEDRTVLWVDTDEDGDSLQDVINAALLQAKESGEFDGSGYVLTEADKSEIAEIVANLFGTPEDGGNIDLVGYATKQWVGDEFQPKGNYLTEVPEGYAKISDIPVKPEDIGAQPAGNYALKNEIPNVPVLSVNGKTGKVTLSASDVDARPSSWMPTASDVGALPNSTIIPVVPSNVSAFTNDVGYLTQHQDISGKLDTNKLLEEVKAILADALAEIGITATITDLNYTKDVTGNIQTQLNNKAESNHDHSASNITSGTLPINRGGIGSANGATGLHNLFAAGSTVLSSYQYGDAFPSDAVDGTVFFKKVT